MDFLGMDGDDETLAEFLSLETMTPREYRHAIAIPNYLRKRAIRNYKRRLIHPSRSISANKKPRNGGKFAKH